jgi:hypothetical protein
MRSAARVRAGAREIKQIKDAEPKACGRKSRVRGRRYAPLSRVIRACTGRGTNPLSPHIIASPMEGAVQEIAGPPPSDAPEGLRTAPLPRRGGLLTLLRFMRRHQMLNAKYARLIAG